MIVNHDALYIEVMIWVRGGIREIYSEGRTLADTWRMSRIIGFTGGIMGFTPLGKEHPVLRPNLSLQKLAGHKCLKRGVRCDWCSKQVLDQGRLWGQGRGFGFQSKGNEKILVQMTEERWWLTFSEDDWVDWGSGPGKAWMLHFLGGFVSGLDQGWQLLEQGDDSREDE